MEREKLGIRKNWELEIIWNIEKGNWGKLEIGKNVKKVKTRVWVKINYSPGIIADFFGFFSTWRSTLDKLVAVDNDATIDSVVVFVLSAACIGFDEHWCCTGYAVHVILHLFLFTLFLGVFVHLFVLVWCGALCLGCILKWKLGFESMFYSQDKKLIFRSLSVLLFWLNFIGFYKIHEVFRLGPNYFVATRSQIMRLFARK